MTNHLRVGIAGLGNVGTGLLARLQDQSALRFNGEITVAGISARNRHRQRPVPTEQYAWFDDPVELASSPETDVFVELIGGSDGIAKLAVEAALKLKKPVVTANKALIAEYGQQLAALAEENGVPLLFEAAVAGGIPVVRAVRESLSGTEFKSIRGILNGTCNFLLTEMLETGRSYEDVLADAQRLGYAEADPFLDVSGTDAAHKIAILSTLGFGVPMDISKVSINGVDTITLKDLELAKKLDHKIKLIAEAQQTPDGVICRVEPVLLPLKSPLAMIHGPLNAVMIETMYAGDYTLTGPGAGSDATASAVLGDLSVLLSGHNTPVFGQPVSALTKPHCESDQISSAQSRYLIRVELRDIAGALAALTESLAGSDVSVEVLLQDSAGGLDYAPVAIMTHHCSHSAAASAVKSINGLSAVHAPARLIRIEPN